MSSAKMLKRYSSARCIGGGRVKSLAKALPYRTRRHPRNFAGFGWGGSMSPIGDRRCFDGIGRTAGIVKTCFVTNR
jgi:hypothetical protein